VVAHLWHALASWEGDVAVHVLLDGVAAADGLELGVHLVVQKLLLLLLLSVHF
jgi:hypothetical protein